MDEPSLQESVDLKARALGRFVSDCQHIEVVRLQEEAAADELALNLSLYDQLGHVEHDLGTGLIQVEKFYDGARVASVFAIDQRPQVVLETALPLLLGVRGHEQVDFLSGQLGQIWIAHTLQALVQLIEVRIPFANSDVDLARLVDEPGADDVEGVVVDFFTPVDRHLQRSLYFFIVRIVTCEC